MSSTQLPSVDPSSTVTPQPPPHDHGAATGASTLLFGFLVSALSVFAIFMTFAIVWNRLIVRRRAIEATLMRLGSDSPQSHRPMMLNAWIVPDRQSAPWPDVKPVAAQTCKYPPRATQTVQAVPFWRRCLLNWLPLEIGYLFYRPTPPEPLAPNDADISHVDLPHGSDIQITFLIAMPQAPLTTRGVHEYHKSREMVFATTNLLYHNPGLS